MNDRRQIRHKQYGPRGYTPTVIRQQSTVPYVPLSHPFVERLIGTIRREYLDHTFFWTTIDLESNSQN